MKIVQNKKLLIGLIIYLLIGIIWMWTGYTKSNALLIGIGAEPAPLAQLITSPYIYLYILFWPFFVFTNFLQTI